MKRLFLCLFLFFTSTLFANITYVPSYQAALSQAKAQNKLIILTATLPNCPWCHKLFSTTLQDKTLQTTINNNFIYAVVDARELPGNLHAMMTPTTFFLDAKGNLLITMVGYVRADEFALFADDALKKAKK